MRHPAIHAASNIKLSEQGLKRLSKKTTLLSTEAHTSENFSFTPIEVENLVFKMLILYEQVIQALKKHDLSLMIDLIAQYANDFFIELYHKKGDLKFMYGYRILSTGFMEFIHECYGINENNFLHYLCDKDIITHSRLSFYIIEQSNAFREKPTLSDDERNLYARSHLIEPFIVALFPISDKKLKELKSNRVNFNLQKQQKKTIIRAMTNCSILNKTQFEKTLLSEVEDRLLSIETRLSIDDHPRWLNFLINDPSDKLLQITSLLLLLRTSTTTMKSFDNALCETLENKAINRHRNWVSRTFSPYFFKPPKIVAELKQIRCQYVQSDNTPYAICHLLR